MDASEFAKSIGFTEDGTWNNDEYTITLADSDEYAKAYTKLDTAKDVYVDPEGVALSEHSSIMKYLSKDFDVSLEADYDNDVYKVVFKEADE
jgi:hypothetical protein